MTTTEPTTPRRPPRQRGGRPKDRREHGTRKGYRQHVNDGTEACDACLGAERDYQRDRRAKAAETGQSKVWAEHRARKNVQLLVDPALLAAFTSTDRRERDRATREVREYAAVRLEDYIDLRGQAALDEAIANRNEGL